MTVVDRPTPSAEVRLVRLPLDAIRPSPENDKLYRPLNLDDPSIQALGDSIAKYGLREPLVVTRDNYILSGHRRYAACRLAGLAEVLCRVENIRRSSPDFQRLLCEYNRQRVKSFDEVVREQVVTTTCPDEAYEALLEQRQAASAVRGDLLVLEGKKVRKRISDAKQEMVEAIRRIIEDQRRYWPLSDRSIHYEMLNVTPLKHTSKPASRYRNDRASYQDLCDLLTRLRLAGVIPFDAIADPTRTVCSWDLHRNVGSFLRRELDGFLGGYWRDLQQSQPNHIEIVGEKNTVEGSVKPVAMKFGIPYTLGRGYCSLDPRHQMFERFRNSGRQKLIILILSDFDPDGEEIAHSFARSMRDDFGVEDVVAIKVCLTYEQVLERNLPRTFDIKKSSRRYDKFAEKYGDRSHELEALTSAERSRLLTEAIDQVMDTTAFNQELEAEKTDAAGIDGLRKAVGPALSAALASTQCEPKEGGR